MSNDTDSVKEISYSDERTDQSHYHLSGVQLIVFEFWPIHCFGSQKPLNTQSILPAQQQTED